MALGVLRGFLIALERRLWEPSIVRVGIRIYHLAIQNDTIKHLHNNSKILWTYLVIYLKYRTVYDRKFKIVFPTLNIPQALKSGIHDSITSSTLMTMTETRPWTSPQFSPAKQKVVRSNQLLYCTRSHLTHTGQSKQLRTVDPDQKDQGGWMVPSDLATLAPAETCSQSSQPPRLASDLT